MIRGTEQKLISAQKNYFGATVKIHFGTLLPALGPRPNSLRDILKNFKFQNDSKNTFA